VVLFYICCKDFDPETDFEKRRRKLAKEKMLRDIKAKKEKAKEEKLAAKESKKK
jgi:hypothetical protein